MSSFTTPLDFRFISEREFELLQDFEYCIGELGNGRGMVITVPKGFVTDLASVPRLLWSLFPPHGKYAKAAVVHDYLYKQGAFSRAWADGVFLEAMGVLGVSPVTKYLVWSAVRVFGMRTWG